MFPPPQQVLTLLQNQALQMVLKMCIRLKEDNALIDNDKNHAKKADNINRTNGASDTSETGSTNNTSNTNSTVNTKHTDITSQKSDTNDSSTNYI